MRELSLHILDIVENGITANGDLIKISINENKNENLLFIEISDNGDGISENMIEKISDPFVTSRTTRKVGLGLSLLKTASERCDGDFKIESAKGAGTKVSVTFTYDHIDRAPLGDINLTLITLIVGNPDVDFIYKHTINSNEFDFDTKEIKKDLGEISISEPVVIEHIKELIRKEIAILEEG